MNTETILRKAAAKLQYDYLLSLLQEKADFPYAIIKGEALSCQAYGKPGERQSSDIDLLIEKQHLKKLEKLLLAAGFETENLTREEQVIARAFSHQTAPYQKKMPLGNLVVDINYELLWGEWDRAKPKVADFLARRTQLAIYGSQAPVLCISDAFLQLCLHHYKDMNSLYHLVQHNPIRTKAFQDVAAFWVRRKNELNLDELTAWIQRYELTPYFYYMAHYAAQVGDAADLEDWAQTLKSPQAEALLDQFGLAEAEKKKWPIPFEQRLDNPDLPKLVQQLLTEQDKEKVRKNQKIFGGL